MRVRSSFVCFVVLDLALVWCHFLPRVFFYYYIIKIDAFQGKRILKAVIFASYTPQKRVYKACGEGGECHSQRKGKLGCGKRNRP